MKQESTARSASESRARGPDSFSVRRRSSSAFWKRWRRAAAARIVNVTAEIRSTVARPVATRATMRSTRLRVFPVPAAASTKIVESRSSAMDRRAASSPSGRASARDSVRLFGMEEEKRREDRVLGHFELGFRALGRPACSSADLGEVAVLAVLLGSRVRKEARRQQVEEAPQDIARLPAINAAAQTPPVPP